MGKKAKFKAIRRMAANLPELNTVQKKGVVMTGKQVIDSGTTEVNGEPVNPADIYRGNENLIVPMNHKKNMKRLYYQHGPKGVKAYVQNVHDTVNPKIE